MSPAAHPLTAVPAVREHDAAGRTPQNFDASRSFVDAATRFEAHRHDGDQLAWMRAGSMELVAGGERRRVRGEHFVWIPAGMVHEMSFRERGELISLYTDPLLRPPGPHWQRQRMLGADDLACALLLHLTDAAPDGDRRRRCLGLLTDILADGGAHRGVIVMPSDRRARAVAARLVEEPADGRELGEWAAELGVSAKTIARAFVAETGQTFREWRIQTRLHAAAGLLEAGASVQSAAAEVGYETASSFIAAFKSRFGVTPARYGAGRD